MYDKLNPNQNYFKIYVKILTKIIYKLTTNIELILKPIIAFSSTIITKHDFYKLQMKNFELNNHISFTLELYL